MLTVASTILMMRSSIVRNREIALNSREGQGVVVSLTYASDAFVMQESGKAWWNTDSVVMTADKTSCSISQITINDDWRAMFADWGFPLLLLIWWFSSVSCGSKGSVISNCSSSGANPAMHIAYSCFNLSQCPKKIFFLIVITSDSLSVCMSVHSILHACIDTLVLHMPRMHTSNWILVSDCTSYI